MESQSISPFCSTIWPEDEVPEKDKNCQECDLFEHGTRMIWGEGNVHAPIMVILDNPGAREDREGNPFVCGTRQTLQKVIHEAGLEPEHFYMTYILKRRPIRTYDKDKARAICMNHLSQQIEVQKPAYIVCLGNVAVQSFFRNPDLDVKGLRGAWHDVNDHRTAVSYHPLAVRRRPNLYPYLLKDIQFIAEEWRSTK